MNADNANTTTDYPGWDVIVIGGGGAGLSAALSAAENGASVLLFESENVLGGPRSCPLEYSRQLEPVSRLH